MTADAVGGVWSYAIELTRQLARRDVEVTLVVMGEKPSIDQAREAAALPNLSLIGTDFRLEWMRDPEADLQLAGELLLEIEAEQRPDVVHLNGYAHAVLPFSAPVLVVGHSCVSSWWEACRGGRAPQEWRSYEERVAAGLSAADLVVAPTQSFLATLLRHHGTPRAARVIPNGRDPALYGAGPKRPVALAAGRLWDEAKNIALLREAAAGLPYPVAVAGAAAGPDGTAIDAAPLVALGRLAAGEVAARLSEAAIFVSPARYEPFGLAVLEAAFSGCALVLADIPTFRELWDGAARFVPADDAAGLRTALAELFEDSCAIAALAAAARRRAAHYTASRMGAGYLAAYSDLIGTNAARPPRPAGLRAVA
ncbi:glycosyltransferase [Rhizobiales bacterium L72]|uniref:Glycosyltransferase n=2 Tax=Propylenella binzhouense TaxID=2555902 RepID=A0A964WUR6_9HYPH|nr:glycosyltransferase [Propylenella binzhouense]